MFSDIFSDLLQKNNVTAYKFSIETGIPQSLLSNYKKGTKSPTAENLRIIADYFNVSVDYLLGRTNATEIVRQQIILNDQTVTIEYSIIESTLEDEKHYGIQISSSLGDNECVPNITKSKEDILTILDKLIKSIVTPISLKHVIYDLMSDS